MNTTPLDSLAWWRAATPRGRYSQGSLLPATLLVCWNIYGRRRWCSAEIYGRWWSAGRYTVFQQTSITPWDYRPLRVAAPNP